MSDTTVYIKALAPRRCRCGLCFNAEGRAVSVTPEQLSILKADPLLDVAAWDGEAAPPPEPAPPAAKAAKAG